eukprot:Phypoly_transcript_11899.p1 GENE.Phypoly_transcript_11899~~Phypoly_transcript_11899.p1  ORF type:complete len:362 (+),score=64.34 Phypoly_transcript_11899:42-1127(+)
MASKSLARIGLDKPLVQRCEGQKMFTCGELLARSDLELVQMLDIPYPVMREVVRFVSEKVAPKPVLLSQKLNTQYLPTTLQGLDEVLRGGIPSSSITEIVGPSGVGKTQLCHMLAVLAAKNFEEESGVIYFDTEKAFSASRLVEIAEGLDPFKFNRTENPGNLVELSQRIIIYDNFNTSSEVLERLESLDDVIVERKVKLIVIDSIASILRKDFDSSSAIARQNLLSKEVAAMKYLSETFSIPVVVTNQVATMFSQNPGFNFQSDTQAQTKHANRIAPALGHYWAHSVNTRLVLEFGDAAKTQGAQGAQGPLRKMTVAKSPSAPVVSFYYQIGAAGLQLDEAAGKEGKRNFWEQNISTRRN